MDSYHGISWSSESTIRPYCNLGWSNRRSCVLEYRRCGLSVTKGRDQMLIIRILSVSPNSCFELKSKVNPQWIPWHSNSCCPSTSPLFLPSLESHSTPMYVPVQTRTQLKLFAIEYLRCTSTRNATHISNRTNIVTMAKACSRYYPGLYRLAHLSSDVIRGLWVRLYTGSTTCF